MRPAVLACYAFALAAGAFLGRFELHTDDTGVEVFFILMATFVLGCCHPRHAWQWALLVGLWIPAADWIFKPAQTGLLAVGAVVILISLAGSYLGALVRKGFAMSGGHAG
jgi:hypothetical protein